MDIINDFVWCMDCYHPHEADLEEGILVDQDPSGFMTCAANGYKEVSSLPEGWEKDYYAFNAKDGYHLFEKNPAIQPDMHCAIRPEVIHHV